MPKKSGLGQQFFVDGYDISGDVGSLGNVSSPRSVLDVTSINRLAVERILNLKDGQMEFNAWWNPSAAGSGGTSTATWSEHIALSRLPQADVIALWCAESSYGGAGAGLMGKQANYDLTRGQDGSLQATVQVLGNNDPVEWGAMLTPGIVPIAVSCNTGLSIDNGVGGGANGINAFLQVSSLSNVAGVSDSGIRMIIQDGSDTVTFATYMTFDTTFGSSPTTVANTSGAWAAPVAERRSSTGAIGRYARMAISNTSGAAGGDIYSLATMIRLRNGAGTTGDAI